MNHFYPILCLSLITFTSSLAQDCQYTVDEQDEFTNQTKRELATQTLATQHDQEKTEAVDVTLMRIDEQPMLMLTYYRAYATRHSFCISPGAGTPEEALQIKFADGTQTELPTITDHCAELDVQVNSAGTRYNYTLTASFLPDQKTIQALQQQPITTLRINFAHDQATVTLDDKLGKGWLGFGRRGNKKADPQTYIQEHISCILP